MKRISKESQSSQSKGFTYKERSAESVKKRAERTGGRYDSPLINGIDSWRAKQGDNSIRILPPTWDDHEHYGYTVWVHQYVGPDSSNYVCPRKMKGQHCPICEAARDARDAGEQEESKSLEAKEQYWCWILDRDADDDPPVPLIYMMSWTMDRDIAALCIKRTGKVLLIDHPDRGQDVTIKRAGQGLKTKYYGLTLEEESPILEDEKAQDQLLDYIQENPVPSVIHYYSHDYLENMLSGKVDQKDVDAGGGRDDDGDDDRPRRRRPAREEDDDDTPRSRARVGAEEDGETWGGRRRGREADEDEGVDDRRRSRGRREEEEEEEKRPVRRRAATDDEGDTAEDDVPPRRTRRADPEEESPRRRRSRDEDSKEEEEKPRGRVRTRNEEEEEEKPRGRVRTRRADNDEEEEAPRRRRRDDDVPF